MDRTIFMTIRTIFMTIRTLFMNRQKVKPQQDRIISDYFFL